MAQGVIFCATAGYPVGAASYDHIEVLLTTGQHSPTGGTATSLGWSSLGGLPDSRDRDNTNIAALCGFAFDDGPAASTYTITLPAGTYPVKIAMGDPLGAQGCKLEVFDDATSRGVLINGTTSGAQRFFDATGTEYTNATWAGSNTAVNILCSSGLLRFTRGGNSTNSTLSYIYVGDAVGGWGVHYFKA